MLDRASARLQDKLDSTELRAASWRTAPALLGIGPTVTVVLSGIGVLIAVFAVLAGLFARAYGWRAAAVAGEDAFAPRARSFNAVEYPGTRLDWRRRRATRRQQACPYLPEARKAGLEVNVGLPQPRRAARICLLLSLGNSLYEISQ